MFLLILQTLPSPVAWANNEIIPGGTSPAPPPAPGGGQAPANNPSNKEPKVQGATDPVDISRGDFILTRQDLFLPAGRGLSVDLTFTYRSRSAYNGLFGYGWDLSYNRRIRKLANNNLVALRGSNRKDEFTFSPPNTYTAPLGVYDTLVQNGDGTYTLTSKHGDVESYDVNGNLTRLQDRNGNALTFAYDPAGLLPITGKSTYFVTQTTGVIAREYRLTRITDTIGRTIDFAYSPEGRLATITYQGRTLLYAYDATGTGDLISVTTPATSQFPSGNTTRYTYTNHNLGSIIDPKNQTYLTNTYDATNDRVTSQTYGTGTSTVIYGQDASGNPTADVTDRRGLRTLFTFDAADHITKMEQFTDGIPTSEPVSYVTLYEYNAAGERTRIVYPRGNATELAYDSKGNLLEIRRKKIGLPKGVNDPTDIVTGFTYDPTFNFVKTIADPRGNVTTFQYDAKGNLTQLQTPDLKLTQFTYNSFGQVATATDPNGSVTQYTYDPATGYLTQLTAGFGTPEAATSSLAYDSVGNVTSVTDANNQASTFTYNALNQLEKVTAPAPFLFETDYSYDANGNLIQVDRQATASAPGPRPPLGTTSPTDDWQSTLYAYTVLDQLASLTDDLGQVTAFTYDTNGNRRTIIDAKSQTTTYDYEERDLVSRVTDANVPVGVTDYLYDENGNLVSIKDAKGSVTAYAYDDFDRLTRTTYADSSFETYAYDAASNLTDWRTPSFQLIQFTYDALNRLTQKTTPLETTTYGYDAGSRLTTAADPDASLTYAYDSLNRVTQVATTSPGLSTTTVGYAYDKVGNRTKLTYPDGSFFTTTYDSLNRLSRTKDAAAATVAQYAYDPLSRRTQLQLLNGVNTTYAYDAANRLLSQQSAVGNRQYTYDSLGNRKSMADPAGTHAYTYDPLSQVTNVDYPTGFAFADTTFTLDAVGNRTQVVAGSATAYTANNLNQYSAVGGSSLTYDPNGNLTSDGTRTYSYDSENRLLTATVIASGSEAIYTYDPFGRRLTKTINGVTSRFLYDGDQILAETDAAGNTTAKYVYGSGIDEPVRMDRGGVVSYYQADGLGSTVALTNSSGAVVERYAYDVYGQPRITDAAGNPRTVSALGNRFLFTGREYDSESGLYHYRARAYSPSLGRFLQWDPLGEGVEINLYAYVDNNPLSFVDPFGFEKGGGPGGPHDPFWPGAVPIPGPGLLVPGPGGAPAIAPGMPIPHPSFFGAKPDAPGGRQGDKRRPDTSGRKETPDTNPGKFRPVRGRPGKQHIETGEVFEKDKFHGDHYEVYRNRKDYERGSRSGSVWSDGRIKETFRGSR